MVTKRQKRAEKKLKNLSKQKEKYPELLKKLIDECDILLEVVDARFAKEMHDKSLERAIKKKGKKLIHVLNKSDLTLKKEKRLRPAVFVSCKTKKGIKELREKIKIEASKLEKKEKRKGILVGVFGYPNTGKSSLINSLIGRGSAKVGEEAGFTKGIQKLKLCKGVYLLDSPGVIPEPHYSNSSVEKIAAHAKLGARSYEKVKDPEIVLNKIVQEHKRAFEKFYRLKFKDAEDLIEKMVEKRTF